MRRSILTLAMTAALVAGWTVPVEAQQNGIVIQNNGVDSADSAAGSDNVRISRAPGNSSSMNAAGASNEVAFGTGERRNRNRQGRDAAPEAAPAPAEEYAAPVDDYVAPAEGDLQTYAEPAAPVEAAQAVVALPSTGIGAASSPLISAALAALAAFGAVAVSLRQRWTH